MKKNVSKKVSLAVIGSLFFLFLFILTEQQSENSSVNKDKTMTIL